jgi:hypothetical protein
VALDFARLGWPVFPLYWVEDGHCSCSDQNCSNPGKHPLTVNGFKNATSDDVYIRTWWEEFPDANIGIATGAPSGLVVLDVDPRHDGDKSLRELEKVHGSLPDGPRVRTGGGGEHLYFSEDGVALKNAVDLRPGLDVRGDGGYVVGVGSNHISGKPYLWKSGKSVRNLSLPPVPNWLRELISNGQPPQHQHELDAEVIPHGQRNAKLASLAGTMRHRGMHQASIEAALLQENLLRCKPPLDNGEVSRIAASVGAYAPDVLSGDPMSEVRAERKLTFRTGSEIAAKTSPAVPWLVKPWVATGAITEADGKAKVAGKTTWVTYLAGAVLDGAEFMGEKTTKTSAVYLTEQNPTSFRATMKRADLLNRDDFVALFWAESLGFSWPKVVRAAVEECKRRSAKLLVVDTLGQFSGLVGDSENNSGDALRAVQPLQVAAREGLAVIIVRHERKSGGSLGDSGRGSSAYAGAVDILLSIRRPEGNHKRNVRLIQAVSRFDETPPELLIELTDDGYRSLGEPGEAAKQQSAREVLDILPTTKAKAFDIKTLVKKTTKTRAELQRLLDALLKKGLVEKIGKGSKGDPFRFFSG